MPFREEILNRLWNYALTQFQGRLEVLEERTRRENRPPVFTKAAADSNTLIDPKRTAEERHAILASIPRNRRHRWFRSMKSSQALAQSVFANLQVMQKTQILRHLTTEDGERPFASGQQLTLEMEHAVAHLGEPRPTEIDVLVSSSEPVAIECKWTEREVGSCSRPRLPSEHPEHCPGEYRCKTAGISRCVLSGLGVRYWEHVPKLFTWSSDFDHLPCPLKDTYQLVRNVLAIGVGPDGCLTSGKAMALLLYDQRNPDFQDGGKGHAAYTQVRAALRNPRLLQRCTWQKVLHLMRNDAELGWLTEHLALKYGL